MSEGRFRSPISTDELERRWRAVRKEMQDQNLDAIVMQNSSDWVGGYVRWFTDIAAGNGYPKTVIFYADAPMTVIQMGPFGAVTNLDGHDPVRRGFGRLLNSPSFVSVGYTNEYDADLLGDELTRSGAKRIGVLTPGALPHAVIRALENLPDVTLSDATDAIDQIKAIKSTEEIADIKKICALQDTVFAAVCDHIAPGMRDVDVTGFAQAQAHRLGSDQGIFLGSSAPMGMSARFMGRPMQGRTIEKGEHMSLLIEINGSSGLYAEIARTIVLGKADDHLLEGFQLMLNAQDHTLSLIRPSALPSDVAAAHDKWLIDHGLKPEARLYAHGQGTDMVERPLIRADETMPFAKGMCLAVHPGFDDGKAWNIVCDNYMVQAGGVGPCLHKTEKRIFEL